MLYSTIFLSALVATGATAGPLRRRTVALDNSIRVILQSQDTGSQTSFEEGWRVEKRPVGSDGPFDTVTLELGKDVHQQSLRCQVRDEHDQPIVVIRGRNVDTTFADGDAGAWKFQDGLKNVKTIICDPAFVKADPPSVRVQLASDALDLAVQTAFDKAGRVREVKNQNPITEFNNVELLLSNVNPMLRCQILDMHQHPIMLQRGNNTDITFADGDAGRWNFINAAKKPITSTVSQIICDPAFVKGSA